MKTVDLITALSWNPCPEYPPAAMERLFDGRAQVSIRDVAATGIPADDFLWFCLHEPLLSPWQLERFRDDCLDRLEVDVDLEGVGEAFVNTLRAAFGDVDDPALYGPDSQAERWKNGASEASRRAALTGLWVAIARARSEVEQEARSKAWEDERFQQARQVLEADHAY